MSEFMIGKRKIGNNHPPLVIAEIGINHEGVLDKAMQMIDDAAAAGCECVKFQSHVIEDEMIPNHVIPANAKESIWDIMQRCALNEAEEIKLKQYTEFKNMIFLSTPFSRAAANRLEKMNVMAYKIGSGECNNYPLISHIARFRKPIILSTGMNDYAAIEKAVHLLRQAQVPFCLLHCTSVYPTPYHLIRLRAIKELQTRFPEAVVGLSDHSLSNLPCLAAVAMGACVLERHFTADKNWPGPDIEISMDPVELKQLVEGSRIIHACLGEKDAILAEENPTIAFAYACVVSIKPIKKGELFSYENIWVKRPGTGEITAENYEKLIGKRAMSDIANNTQIKLEYVAQELANVC